MSETPKGSPTDHIISKLDSNYLELLNKIREQLYLDIIQSLVGGYSGAHLFLVNAQPKDGSESNLVILKLDQYDKKEEMKWTNMNLRWNHFQTTSNKHTL